MSARTRRSLTLTWTALFVLSLLLQYFAFAAAPPALAAHDIGLFELEGNADDEATPGADWENGPEGALDSFFVGASSEAAANDDTYFQGGGSKDENDVPDWAINATGGAPDKDELLDAYAAVYQLNDETWVYFGADRFDNDGTAQIGIWFFQDEIGISGGDFTGAHVDGDVLIISEYTNGGVVSTICAYVWDGSGGGDNIDNAAGCDEATNGSNLNLVAAGSQCDVADGTFDICAVTNADVENAPWPFLNKDGESDFGPGQFFEGGINLTDMFGGDAPCFGSILFETRTSAETDAQLKDFALGDFNTCVPPDIETDASVDTADFGDEVTDTATLSGSQGEVTGSVTFFICTPAEVTAAGCPDGSGTQVGGAVTIDNESATSDAYTVGTTADAVGTYCWRAEYTPDEGSNYLAASHTNATTECFTVEPAVIDITKSADADTVVSGGQIGFTVTVTNTGAGTALDVTVDDPLPAGTGIDWSIDPASPGWSITGSPPDETLVFGPADLGPGESTSVHVVSDTTDDSCGVYLNIASVTTSNNGSDEAGDSTEVIDCPVPELGIEKSNNAPITTIDLGDGTTIDLPTAEEGDTVTYTLEYSVVDEVTNAVIDDVLPEGVTYVDGTASSDAQFAFVGYDDASRTLTWEAPSVTEGGTLTYDVTIDEGAAELQQPLINVATIDSDETPPDSDDSPVFVQAPPLELTPPPTDVFAPSATAGNPGFALMLVLLAIAGLALTIGFITPVPESVRRRDRLG